MKSERQYKQEWTELAKRFGFSYAICRHITNSYKDKYSDLDYKDGLVKIRKEAEKKLVEVNRALKFGQLELIRIVSQNIMSPKRSKEVMRGVEREISYLKPMMESAGFLKEVINSCHYLTPDELKEWVEYEF